MSFGFSTFNQIPFATQLEVEAGVVLVGSVTASGSVQGVTVTGEADFVTGAIFASGVVNAVDSVTGGAAFTTDSVSGTAVDPKYALQLRTLTEGVLSDDQVKFGDSSLRYYAQGYDQNFSAPNNCIEFFFYPTTWGSNNTIQVLASMGRHQIRMWKNSSGTERLQIWDTVLNFAPLSVVGATNLNQWNHIAIQYFSGAVNTTAYFRLFLNGVQRGSSTLATANFFPLDPAPFYLGGDSSGSNYLGYIDEFRVSTNIRYVGSYTVPTAAFTDNSDTLVLYHFDEGDGYRGILSSDANNTPVGNYQVEGGALFTTSSTFGTGVINPVTATGGAEITVGSITAEGVIHPLDSVIGGADFTILAPNAGIMPAPVYTFQVNTFGTGVISDDQAKFGNTSLRRCAIGNYQTFFSTGHTIEFFFYPTTWGGTIDIQTLGDFGRFRLRMSRVGLVKKFLVQDTTNSSDVLEWEPSDPDDLLNQWNHVALEVNTWSATFWQDLILYVNGSFRDTIRIFPSFTNPPLAEEEFILGGGRGQPSNNLFNNYSGFIDEFRVSSVRRYAGSYTIPTSAFTDDDDTVVLYHFDEGDGHTGVLTNSSDNTPVGTHKVLAGAAAATTGINADGIVGAVSEVIGGANFTVTGAFGTGTVTNVNVYGIVFSDQNPSYNVVSTGQEPSYTTISPTEGSNLSNIAPSQNANYSEVNPSQSPNYDEEV